LPTLTSFLPFTFSKHLEEQNKALVNKPLGLPIFEPSKKLFFNSLFQKYIEIFFHSIILETKLSEISARTVAMEHASITTENIIQKITAYYLKQRRLIETQKQLESFSIHKNI